MIFISMMCVTCCQAAELLGHPLLQPIVHKIHLKLNSPRRSTFPCEWSDSDYTRKTRFMELNGVPFPTISEKRLSFSNDRTLNPTVSGNELDSPYFTRRSKEFPYFVNQRFAELAIDSTCECDTENSVASKFSTMVKSPRLKAAKASATPRGQTTSRSSRIGLKRDSVCSVSLFLMLSMDNMLIFSFFFF